MCKNFFWNYVVMLVIFFMPDLLDKGPIFSQENLLSVLWLTIFAVIVSLPIVEKSLIKCKNRLKSSFFKV